MSNEAILFGATASLLFFKHKCLFSFFVNACAIVMPDLLCNCVVVSKTFSCYAEELHAVIFSQALLLMVILSLCMYCTTVIVNGDFVVVYVLYDSFCVPSALLLFFKHEYLFSFGFSNY